MPKAQRTVFRTGEGYDSTLSCDEYDESDDLFVNGDLSSPLPPQLAAKLLLTRTENPEVTAAD